MIKVDFYDLNTIEDSELTFAVIMAKHKGKWVYSKHKDRDTWEIPGGHREKFESIDECASRELIEETGANNFKLTPLCIYSVKKEDETINDIQMTYLINYGQIYYAEVEDFNKLPDFEIEKIEFFDDLPDNLTYPQIQPLVYKKVLEILK